MRLSDAGLRQPKTKLIYPDHRLPPWPNEDATRDRSNRLLGIAPTLTSRACDAVKRSLSSRSLWRGAVATIPKTNEQQGTPTD